MNINEKLATIQKSLKVKKAKQGSVQYAFRSNEKILEAVKPLLDGATIVQQDEVVQVGSRYYIKATTALIEGSEQISSTAYAREEENSRVGLNQAQITGSCSSYARKYSICGLLAIDDSDQDIDQQAGRETQFPKRSEVNKALKEMTDINVFNSYAQKFKATYGPNCFDEKSGHKTEIWSNLFKVHKDRILGVSPIPGVNQTPQEMQEEWSLLAKNCSNLDTVDILERMVNQNKALDTEENWAVLEDLHSEFD